MILEVLKTIGSLFSTVVAMITLMTLLSNRFRDRITGFFKERNAEVDKINHNQDDKINNIERRLQTIEENNKIVRDFMQQQCKSQIKNVFYKYRNTQVIPYYEWQCMDAAYTIYHDSLKGNHDISCLYEQMCKWNIDCSEKLGDD